ncbi:MAG: tetratricopeptide repeat protein [Elusimicrobiaceae bacterium]|nr:tetratricopeptide repeat protein [Elusimicrobiaceae bacterium]
MKKLNRLLAFLAFGFLSLNLFAWDKIDPAILIHADKGVDAIYNLDLPTARTELTTVLKEHPNYPLGLFGQVMIEWARYEYEFEKSNIEQAKVFENLINSSISGIETWLKQNKDEAQAYLALGGIYGVKARFLLANRSYVRAYFTGKKGLKYMNKAVELDPEMYDAYLGKAIYEYYAGTLPAVVKVLAKLVISGNAEKGIEYLNLIKDKGRYSANTAKLLLVEIAIQNKKYSNPPLAEQYIKEIIAKYPQNPLFRFVAIIAAYQNKNYTDVRSGAQDFLNKIGKEPFYKEIYIARSYTALASADMQEGKYPEAIKVLEQSIEATKHQEMSRWQLWNIFRLAQSYDALGQREKALEIYKSIKNYKEDWGIYDEAKKYLKTPFTAGADIGLMSPP